MSDPKPDTRIPSPHIPVGKPALSAAELASAVLNASEAVGRAASGDMTGAVKTSAEAVTPASGPPASGPPASGPPAPEKAIPLDAACTHEEARRCENLPEAAETVPLKSEPVATTNDSHETQPRTCGEEPVESEAGGEKEKEKEKEKKRGGLGPRWSYIITRGLVVALVWGFFAFAFDPLVRFGAVQSAQAVAGSRVDVEEFATEFFPPRIQLAGVAVANRRKPGTNLVEFDSLQGEVDGLALMKKSYVLNRATITGLRWGTDRSDSGLLDEAARDREQSRPSELPGKLKEAGRKWADGLLNRAAMKYDPRNLETYVLADQLEDEWKTDFDDLELRIDDVEGQARRLKELFEAARKDPLRNLAKIDQIVKEGLRLKGDLNEIRTDVTRLPPKAQEDVTALNEARHRDTERIQREVRELVLDEDKLSEFLLGPELHHKVSQAVSWLRWTDDRVDRVRSTQPERTRGEDIPFTDRNPQPRFLARLIELSGAGEIGGDQLKIQGTVSDVTNDPRLLGRPTIVRIEGTGEAAVRLHATIDRTKEVPSNELNLTYSLLHATDSLLGDDDTLAVIVHASSTRWTANLRTLEKELSGSIVLTQKPVRLEAKLKDGADDRLRQVVESSVASIDEVQATVTLSGTVDDPKWKIRTTLGRQISRGVQRGMNSVISAEKQKLVARLDGELKDRQQAFLGKLNGRYGTIAEQLRKSDSLLNELNASELIQRVSGGRLDPRSIFKRK